MSPELETDIKKFLTDRSIKQIDLMNKYNISRNTLKKYIEYIANKKCILYNANRQRDYRSMRTKE